MAAYIFVSWLVHDFKPWKIQIHENSWKKSDQVMHKRKIKNVLILTLVTTGFFLGDNVARGGGANISPPPKILFFSWFCKFCFYRGLDMYINGQNPKYKASSF